MSVDINLPMPAFRIGTTNLEAPVAQYTIWRETLSRGMMRVARQTIDCAGRVPIRSWVLVPCNEYGAPVAGTIYCLDSYGSLRTHKEVDAAILRHDSDLELVRVVIL